jgi:integrase
MNFRESFDKNSIKQQDNRDYANIYSYSEKYRLLDVANDFSTYLKTNFPKVRYIKEIQEIHIQEFLNSKKSCTQNTVDSYYNSLKKLELVSNKCYGLIKNNIQEVVIPAVSRKCCETRGANHPITEKDYVNILEYCANNPCESADALLLNLHCIDSHGLRVEEIARIKIKNIDNSGLITIDNAKGGKTYQVQTSNIPFLEIIISKKYDVKNDRLFSINGASINKYLNRLCDKLNLGDTYSFHDIRRYHAQNYYDKQRNMGLSAKDSLAKTSTYLSHNTARERMMSQSYVKIW